LNAMRLPVLRTIYARNDFWPWPHAVAMDLRPLLEHASALKHLDVALHGLPLTKQALPNLSTVVGTTQDCLTLCGGDRPIHTLDLVLPFPEYDLSVREHGILNHTLLLSRLADTPTLRRLFLSHGGRQDVGFNSTDIGYLPLSTLSSLARSCCNLTHLDVCADGSLEEIAHALAPISTLRWLRLRLRQTTFDSIQATTLEITLLPSCSQLRLIWLENHGSFDVALAVARGTATYSGRAFLIHSNASDSLRPRIVPYPLSNLMRQYAEKSLDF